ncbi:MAG TPA: FHA domain-containing protein [Streptomyces sp.]|nr:FHA domain-containing protein [Streptomyces sp.]
MQIRLTVVDPLGPPPSPTARARAASCDVLVTAPAGTALAAVSSALASAVPGGDGPAVLYAAGQRLDAQRCTLGEPPLIDGAVLSVGAPLEPEAHPELDDAPVQLHVVAGPDAGGVHLLHGGEIRVGRSDDADVPLDDPDVSRLHCAVTVAADGSVAVADLGSTNGTLLDGSRVTGRPVRFAPGALLRVGESALRLAPCGGPGSRVETTPDGEGHVRVAGDGTGGRPPAGGGDRAHARVGGAGRPGAGSGGLPGPAEHTHHAYGEVAVAPPGPGAPAAPGAHGAHGAHGGRYGVPGQGRAPLAEGRGGAGAAGDRDAAGRIPGARPGPGTASGSGAGGGDTHGGRGGAAGADIRGGAGPTADGLGSAGTGPQGSAGTGAPGAHPAGGPGTPAPARGSGSAGAADPRGGGAAGDGYGRGGAGAGDTYRHGGGTGPAETYGHGGTGPAETYGHGGAGAGDTYGRGGAEAAGARAPGGAGRRAGDGHGLGDARAENGYGHGDGAGAYGTGGATAYGAGTARLSSSGAGGEGYAADAASGPEGTPVRGADVPQGARRRGGLSAWARRLAGGRGEQRGADRDGYDDGGAAAGDARAASDGPRAPEAWPDPAALLLTALGPGPRLWERGTGHREALTVRLGTADRAAPDGGLLPAVPVTAGLREAGALGLAGPRGRLAGLARTVLAQLAALHSPETLEIALISADPARPLAERTAEWSWLGWLPHVRPGHGQDCRLLLAHDREQAAARADELLRRLDDHRADRAGGHGPDHPTGHATGPVAGIRQGATAGTAPQARPHPHQGAHPLAASPDGPAPVAYDGPYAVLVVDGDPGGPEVRDAVARLALEGPRAGIHVVCLAETAAASPVSPVTETYEAACAVSPVFRECGAVALLSGDVATALRLLRVARAGASGGPGGPVGHGTVGTVDAVSLPWAERFARALAPLRTDGGTAEPARVSAPLPQAARLLDELGLARATPASLMARWAAAADDPEALGGRACAVLGAGPRGPVGVDLAAEGPHLLVEGPPGSGRTELLRAVVASLAAAERPDRLGIVLVDGRGTAGAGGGPGEGLHVAMDVPHVTTHLTANDPVRMREFAQALSAELKRRAELLGRSDFTEWHTGRELSGRMVAQRTAPAAQGAAATAGAGSGGGERAGDLEGPPSSTLRLRPGAGRGHAEAAPPLPRLVVVVDDLDALVSPALGAPGRPAAGSVMRALESVARDGDRLGVHLVAASAAADGRTAETEPVRRAGLRVELDAPGAGPDEPAPGRGRLTSPDGRVTPFQGGRVTGRIPRTATLRPTVVPLEWHRMGDPPARRPVRELGNGPTDLALLASALERAAREVSAAEVPSLLQA